MNYFFKLIVIFTLTFSCVENPDLQEKKILNSDDSIVTSQLTQEIASNVVIDQRYQIKIKDVTKTSFTAYYDFFEDYPYYYIFMDGKSYLGGREVREHTFSSLTPGKTYQLSGLIRHVLGGTKEVSIAPVQVTLLSEKATLGAIVLKSLNSTETSVDVEVVPVPNAQSYNYALYIKEGSAYSYVSSKTVSQSSITFSALKPAQAYQVRVYAQASGYENGATSYQDFTTKETVVVTPPPPTSNDPYQIKIKNITSNSFTAYFEAFDDWPYNFMYINGVQVIGSRNIREYTVTNAQVGKEYQISGLIRHVLGGNRDVAAGSIKFIFSQTAPTLGKATIKSVNPTDSTASIEVYPVPNAQSYNYALYIKEGSAYSYVSSKTVSQPSITFSALKPAQTYQVRVYAQASGYENGATSYQDFTTKETVVVTPPPPTSNDPYQIKIKNITSNSFTAYFDAFDDWPYNFMYINGVQVIGSRNIREYTVTNAQVGKEYQISGLIRHVLGGNRDVAAGSVKFVFEGQASNPSTPTNPTSPPSNDGKIGTTLESFGGNPFYTEDKFFGNIDIKYVSATKSIIQYKGSDAPFTDEFLGKEFVALRAHWNQSSLPSERNYFPDKLSSRYSKVIRILDGKNLEVDFGYNGGNPLTPQNSINAYGYFFYNNQNAFIQAFSSIDRDEKVLLKSGKTYVTKGGWNIRPRKALNVLSDGVDNASIKISMEDFFSVLQDTKGENASFVRDYKTAVFFDLGESDHNVIFDGINILPSYFYISRNQPGAGLFFKHDSPSSGVCENVRELTVKDSDTLKEFKLISEKYPQFPKGHTPLLPQYAYSMCGGKDDGYDVTDYQEFKILNSSWIASTVFDVKNAKHRAGNFIHVKGDGPYNRSRLGGNLDVYTGQIKNLKIKYSADENGNYRNVKLLTPGVTTYDMSNLYWEAGLSHGQLHLFKFPEGTITFGGFLDFKASEADGIFERPLILDAKTMKVTEAVPVIGKTYKAAKIINSNTIRIDGLMVLVGDAIRIGNVNHQVIAVNKGYDHGALGNYIDAQVSGLLGSDLDITFLESKSQEFLRAEGKTVDFIYNDDAIGYLLYTNTSINILIENVDLAGRIRASDHMNSDLDNQKLYKQASVITFRDAHYKGTTLTYETGAANQLAESSDLKTRSLLTGKPHYAILDHSTIFWNRLYDHQNEVYFANHPTLIYGNTSIGGPRFLGGIYQDGQGFTIATGGRSNFEFLATNNKYWDLSNMKMDINGLNQSGEIVVGGNGTIDFTGLSRTSNSQYFPSIMMGSINGINLPNTGILKLVANSGEGAIGRLQPGNTFNKQNDMGSFYVEFDNWTLGVGLWCDGNCFSDQSSETYKNNILINR